MCSIIWFISLMASGDDWLKTSICITSCVCCATAAENESWIFMPPFTGDALFVDDNSVAMIGVFSDETFWLFSWEFSDETSWLFSWGSSDLFSWTLSVQFLNVFSCCFWAKSIFTSVMYFAFFACVYRPVFMAATNQLTFSVCSLSIQISK